MGKPIRMSGSNPALTERNSPECRLQESETQVRRILDGCLALSALLAL